MTNEEIDKKVKEIVMLQCGLNSNQISDDSNLLTDLGMDSLDYVELIMEIEDELNIHIADEDADRMLTVSDICKYMHNKLNKAS